MPLVRVHVVTYRRPHLLERALRALVSQTEQSWIAEVLNDDPHDSRVSEVIARVGDPRIVKSVPSIRRGGTGNFNYAFRRLDEPFASILEDDNWWEPRFLRSMLAALRQHPEAQVAVGNENIWYEREGGVWESGRRTIWAESSGVDSWPWRIEDKLGAAKLCNSAMLWRTPAAEEWKTPGTIPIDVTEHFRERVVPHPIILVSEPNVNYSVTLQTYRDSGGVSRWGAYQVMLIGSAFVRMKPAQRIRCAKILWERARGGEAPLKTTLITTGLAVPAARILYEKSSSLERARWLLTYARRFREVAGAFRAVKPSNLEWQFLNTCPFPDS